MIYNKEALSVIREIIMVSNELKYDSTQLVDAAFDKKMVLDTNVCDTWLKTIKDDVERLEQACNALKKLKQSISGVRQHLTPYEYLNVDE